MQPKGINKTIFEIWDNGDCIHKRKAENDVHPPMTEQPIPILQHVLLQDTGDLRKFRRLYGIRNNSIHDKQTFNSSEDARIINQQTTFYYGLRSRNMPY